MKTFSLQRNSILTIFIIKIKHIGYSSYWWEKMASQGHWTVSIISRVFGKGKESRA